MTRFTADTRAEAVVAAAPSEIWAALTDASLVARLTPFVRRITEDTSGDTVHWRWDLAGLSVLGVGFSPTFTERMEYDEPRRIDFRPDPPTGSTEPAAVTGWYTLAEADGGTRLSTALEVSVDLPLPRVSRAAVRSAMRAVLAQMGARFSRNLLDHLETSVVDGH